MRSITCRAGSTTTACRNCAGFTTGAISAKHGATSANGSPNGRPSIRGYATGLRLARGDVPLCLGHRLVGGSPRPEAVAVLGERWIPPLLENLQQGLLDQSIDDARDAELSDPAIRLGDFDPLDRLRLVGSREQFRPDVWPVLTQIGLGARDGHPIDARATFVTANAFPRSYEICSVAHLLHQLFCAGRAFGCGLRHGWFGPLVSAARGFTPAFWDQGQRVLDLLPRSTHELPVLLAALNRSAFDPRFRLDLSV